MSAVEWIGAVGPVSMAVCGVVKHVVSTLSRERMHKLELAYAKAALSKGHVMKLVSVTPPELVPGNKSDLPAPKPPSD